MGEDSRQRRSAQGRSLPRLRGGVWTIPEFNRGLKVKEAGLRLFIIIGNYWAIRNADSFLLEGIWPPYLKRSLTLAAGGLEVCSPLVIDSKPSFI